MCEGLSKIANNPIPPHPTFLEDLSSLSINSNRVRSDGLCEGPSKISGPLISHFANTSDNNNFIDFDKNPRVRDSSGKANFLAHKNGNGVALLIQLEGKSITPRSYKIREPPKNYIASNQIKIKHLMRKAKEREAQKQKESIDKNTPVKALWKSNQYKNVQSKLKEILLQEQPNAPRDPNKTFLRAHERTGSVSRPQTARELSTKNSETLNSPGSFKSKDDIDFIKHNQQIASQVNIKRAPSVEQLKKVQAKLNEDLEKYNNKIKGKVPQYLEQRKEEARKNIEEYRKNLPDPDQPPGHRKLPDDERIKTLKLLEESHKKLLSELNSMPIRNDTFRLQTSKSDIEKRLTELDEAIKIFSKPKVFVKIDG